VLAWLAHPYFDEPWVETVAPAVPLLAAATAIVVALGLHAVAVRTPARLMYEPPRIAGALVRAATSTPAARGVGPRHVAARRITPEGEVRARRGARHAAV
jgi:hypothetical protein